MTTSESKGRFIKKTNRFESIRIANRIESIRIANWNALLLSAIFTCLGPWAPPAERGPSLESINRISLTLIFAKVKAEN